MLCYFFCTQEIFGSVAPDVQRGVQVSGGYETPGFTVVQFLQFAEMQLF